MRNNILVDKFESGYPRVQDVMTKEFVSLSPDNSIADAVSLMGTHSHVRHILIMDSHGQIVGEVSYPSILYALTYTLTSQNKKLEQIMDRRLTTIGAPVSLATAIDVLLAKNDGCLTVLTDDGAVCGIVTPEDLLRSYQEYLESL